MLGDILNKILGIHTYSTVDFILKKVKVHVLSIKKIVEEDAVLLSVPYLIRYKICSHKISVSLLPLNGNFTKSSIRQHFKM